MIFKDISNFNNVSDYLSILNGCVNADLIILFLVFHGVSKSVFLKKWYKKYQLSAVIADVLILVIGIIFALAMILNQLVSLAMGYVLRLFPSLMTSLGENATIAIIVGFLVILIIGFLLGILVALGYNLMAKSKRLQLVLETA